MKIILDHTTLELMPHGDKGYAIAAGEQSFEAELLGNENGRLELLLDGEHIVAYVSSQGNTRWITFQGRTYQLTRLTGQKRGRAGHEHESDLTAPMPGQVRAVNVQEGEAVRKGQTLMVVEAMKMELRIQAPQEGIVKKLFVQAGQTVEREQLLIEVEEQS